MNVLKDRVRQLRLENYIGRSQLLRGAVATAITTFQPTHGDCRGRIADRGTQTDYE